jgi:RNA polymerase sigma-70 factor, ECF subfamily
MSPVAPANVDAVLEQFVAKPNEEHFAALFRVLAPQLLVYFRARGCEVGVAEDLTQEVMLTLFRKVDGLRELGLFRPWLFRIAKNELLQYLRQQGRRVETLNLPDELGSVNWNPFAGLALGEWLACLPAGDRELLLLRYVDGFAYHEISELLEMPMGTVQWRVFQLKKRLAEHFR